MTFTRPVPVFDRPEVSDTANRILPPGRYQVQGKPERFFQVQHPLASYNTFVKLPDGRYAVPEFTVAENGRTVKVSSGDWRLTGTAVCIIALLLTAAVFIIKKRKKELPPDSRTETCFLISAAVLLRWALLLYEISFWDNVIPCAADEPGYFKCIYDTLHLSFKGPWMFTIGLGVWYLPFVLLSGAEKYYDIAVQFSYFNAFFIAPAALALVYPVLRNFRVPRYGAFAAILLWAVYPFFIYHGELWNQLKFFPIAAMPSSWEGAADWWRFYAVCINAGFNAMSDMPGLLSVLATVWLAQKLQAVPRNVFLIGMAYGFCCLIRINYIFFAPVIAFIIFRKLPEYSWKNAFKICGVAAAGFLLLFGWQLAVNFYQFGNILTFGYSMHYPDFAPVKRPDAGFTFHTLLEWKNTKSLLGSNSWLIIAGILGLAFSRERYSRIGLALFVIPLILFFLGYSHTYCDARRFIMAAFPVLLGAFCGTAAALAGSRKYLYFAAMAICGVLLIMLPPEIYAICLLLLLLRSLWDLYCELSGVILSK